MKIKSVLLSIVLSSIVIAQTDGLAGLSKLTFNVVQFSGKIDNSAITMLLTFYPDSIISGYYYYDKIGRLFMIKNSNKSKSLVLEAEQLELFNLGNESRNTEIFEFSSNIFENNDTLIGKWIYKNRTHSFNLTKENLKFDWRLFRYRSIGYFKNSYFSVQTKYVSIFYPSISSSPKLNTFFLTKNYLVGENILELINSSESKYLFIEQNFGENTTELDDCCWSDFRSSELVYISDSILTYCNDASAYGHNMQYYTDFISVNVTNGMIYTENNIFKEDMIDTVLALLRNKYKNVLRQEGINSNNNDEAPLPSDYTEESNIYLSKGGVYFRERSYKLANCYDLFLSFDEINNYLNTSFKITIGLR